MTRSTCVSRSGVAFALFALLSTARPAAAGNTTLINCTVTGAASDPITHGFYIPNYPGTSLRNLTLNLSSDTTGHFIVTLTAHLDSFDGPVLGSATNVVGLIGAAASTAQVFAFADFTALPVPKGHTIAFVLNRQGGDPGVVSFATGATGACAAVETNDLTPPLSGVKGSATVTVTGD